VGLLEGSEPFGVVHWKPALTLAGERGAVPRSVERRRCPTATRPAESDTQLHHPAGVYPPAHDEAPSALTLSTSILYFHPFLALHRSIPG